MNKYRDRSKAPRRVFIPRCSEKVSFRRPSQAAGLARKYGQSCYRCPLCSRYHLTSGANLTLVQAADRKD